MNTLDLTRTELASLKRYWDRHPCAKRPWRAVLRGGSRVIVDANGSPVPVEAVLVAQLLRSAT